MDTINADSPSEPAVAENNSAGQEFMKAILSGG